MATYSGIFDNNGYTLYLDVSESNVSVSNNTSLVSWTLRIVSTKSLTYGSWDLEGTPYSVTIDGSKVASGSKTYDFRNYQSLTIASGSKTITHNSDGSRSVSVSATFGNSNTPIGDASASGTMTLTTIPRASKITSFTGNSIDSYLYVRYTYYDSSFTNKIRISIPNVKVLEYATTTSFKLSDETLNYIYSYTTNSKTITLGAVVETWSGNTKVGESEELTLTLPITGNPTVGTFTYADTNSHTTNITKDNQIIIRNSSNLVFTIGTATPKKSATISKYEVTFNGITKSRTSAGTLDFGTINLANNDTAKLSVIDSRGNTSTKNITIKIEDWVLPTGLITLNRKNNFYSETYLTVDGTISSLNGKNSISIVCKYKKVSDTTYTSISLEDNIQKVLELDNNFQWNIVVTISDKIGSTTYNLILDRGMPLIFFDRLLSSIGVNCFPSGRNKIYDNGLPLSGTTFAQMFTKGEKSFASNVLTIVDNWNTNANVANGKFYCEPTNKRMVIPAGTAEYIEVSGNIAGYGSVYGYLSISDSSSGVDSIPFLIPINNYFSISIASRIIKIPDTKKDYYVKLELQGYNGATFIINNGFGDGATYINVKKIL